VLIAASLCRFLPGYPGLLQKAKPDRQNATSCCLANHKNTLRHFIQSPVDIHQQKAVVFMRASTYTDIRTPQTGTPNAVFTTLLLPGKYPVMR